MMLKVGLTGGIGVGKTTVSDHFKQLDVPVVDTDVIAHELVVPGSPALCEIVATFGPDVLTGDGELDRKLLGRIVFADPKKRNQLESFLHPKIKAKMLAEIQCLNAPYCILVVPLLIETDYVELVDKVLLVDAPDEKRIDWIKRRSGLSESTITNIIASQTTREQRLAAADYVIVNDTGISELQAKVLDVHNQLLSLLDLNTNR